MTIGRTLLLLSFFILAPMTTSFYLSQTRSIVRQDVTRLLTKDDFTIPIAMTSHIRSITVINQSIITSTAQQYTINDQKNQILRNGRPTFVNMLKMIRNRLNRVFYALSLFIWLSLFLLPTQPVTAAVTTADTITTTTLSTSSDNVADHSSLGQEQQQYGQFHRKKNSRKKNQLKLRLITGSALIFVTGVVRTKKFREQKESNSTLDNNATENDIFLPVASEDKESVNRPNLNWLLPQTNRDDNNNDKEIELSTAASATNSESKFISIRNKFNESTKIVERLTQQTPISSTNTMKPNGTNNNNNNNKISNGVTKDKTKRVNNRIKSKQEEEELQAKYASIESLEERAYTILVDLGMVGPSTTTDPLDSTWE